MGGLKEEKNYHKKVQKMKGLALADKVWLTWALYLLSVAKI